MEEVQQAITSLFQDGNSEADAWLRDFQKSQGAWEIADQLLRIDGAGLDPAFHLHCLFFAANTMYQKVRWDFYELGNDAAAHKQLRESIVEHCQTYATGQEKVLDRLTLVLASLALQTPSWGGGAAVKELFGIFGSVQEAYPCMLHILTAFLDEGCKSGVRMDADQASLTQLSKKNC